MQRAVLGVCGVAACLFVVGLEAQSRPAPRPVADDAARVIVGDGAVIAPATFVVQTDASPPLARRAASPSRPERRVWTLAAAR